MKSQDVKPNPPAQTRPEPCKHLNRYVAVRHESGLAVHRCRDCGQRC